MAKVKIDCVSILAGGGGTRLWPASTEQCPKQFMKIASHKSLLLQTLERSWSLEPRVGVFVVCNQKYTEGIRQEIALLPSAQAQKTYVLPEPCMCNTAAALFYANQLIEELAGPEATVLVQTSDHLIGPPEQFQASIAAATKLASQQRIVVFGLEPQYPATGYGYIERGEAIQMHETSQIEPNPTERNNKAEQNNKAERNPAEAFHVVRFTEKPDLETAQKFVDTGRFYWNSGMFCYCASLFRKELQTWTPAIPEALEAASSQLSSRLQHSESGILLEISPELKTSYENCQSISVDYAVMEKTDKLGLLNAKFEWNDIGSWDVLAEFETASSSESKVVEVGQSADNFVRSSIPVALCNVSNLIVVEENGILLICQKGASEQVKEARALLQE